jgi:ATP-dependent DNA helicase RecG
MASSDRGGVIVVGVADKTGGPAAFVGTHLDVHWLRGRIYALTQPSYTVEIDVHVHAGARLYLIDVPAALEEIRCAGKLRTRIGTDCVELTGDRAREFLERRRGYDWSAEPSDLRFSQASTAALASARSKYQAARGLAPDSDLELCRRMNLLLPATSRDAADLADPEFNRAGALLLAPHDPQVERLVVLVTEAEGLSSTRSVRGGAPLLSLFDQAWDLLTEEAFPAALTVVGTTRRLLRRLPDLALREALANAIMHRDYRQPRRQIVVQAIGGDTVKVRSPGGFVTGIRADRLITSPSVTRNPTLAGALRILGLAEGEGVGVDTMYAQMLRAGHPAPVIDEDAGDVVVILHGSTPDTELLEYFDQLARRDRGLDDVRTAMAVTTLLETAQLRAEELADLAQCTPVEARTTLTRLESADVVTRLVNRSRAFRLSQNARDRLARRIRYPTRRRLEEHLNLVRAFLDSAPQIGREEAATLLGVADNSASRILSDLSREGSIVPIANARGAGVRYRLPHP